ncbi:MAG: RND transporter [Deltaproteobacteria bacterium]|nr:RND transporter [Deltaproteobacteria bacterium]MBT4088232.1 RND transporter [Deltaproteobacteria bacterium]MBT4263224.1 RND transporter [Deltaproteobacteria bacterium]MBT4642335.1 RND transporter [Deltaproteobacteria bacterium]MBT6500540.1 RND transporter [Deltaproteobacteria bacterium]
MNWIANLKWSLVLILCLTVGLAPFSPPHIWEKLQMLFAGDLKQLIDWFDLLLHGSPWILLLLKIAIFASKKGQSSS